MNKKSLGVLCVLGLACGLSSSAASAAVIELNVPTFSNLVNGVPVFSARHRFDTSGGVDQMLFKQPNPAGYPGADTVRVIVTGRPRPSSVNYDFSLSHVASSGLYTFRLFNGTVEGGATFAGAGANSTLSYTFTPGELSYNVLHLYAQASVTDASATYSNLSFVPGSGLTTLGTIMSGGTATPVGISEGWLVADPSINLDSFDWTLGGKTTLARNSVTTGAEAVKFEISGKRVAVIPEPAAAGLLAPASILLLRRRR